METTNEIMNMNDIVKVAQSTALTVSQQAEQMGIVLHKLGDHDKKLAELEDRMVAREHRELVDRAQCRQIRKAVVGRVNKVLKIKFDGGKVAGESVKTDVLYRGGFISRCYADAKNHSKMGDSYRDTLAIDFDEVMEYINSWYPEVDGGTDAYKHYLDIRREERAKLV